MALLRESSFDISSFLRIRWTWLFGIFKRRQTFRGSMAGRAVSLPSFILCRKEKHHPYAVLYLSFAFNTVDLRSFFLNPDLNTELEAGIVES